MYKCITIMVKYHSDYFPKNKLFSSDLLQYIKKKIKILIFLSVFIKLLQKAEL